MDLSVFSNSLIISIQAYFTHSHGALYGSNGMVAHISEKYISRVGVQFFFVINEFINYYF